jgi:hypothetical protein
MVARCRWPFGERRDRANQPDLDKLIPIFFDYGGAAVCVELSDNPDSRAGWHWSEASLEPYADIWEMLDNWMLSLRR